jgi:ubiquinone/menaquinone biosynthesis C-methylase UbiE
MIRPHPVFASVYAGVAQLGERSGYGRRRSEALTGARGRLLVVGLGPGHDLAHIPAGVSSVVAVEPDAAMRRRSAVRMAAAPVPVTLLAAVAEALPLRDESVDSALAALVLCSVQDLLRAAAELRRVLRPGGTLHVLEHVHAERGSALARWQDRLDPLWSRAAAGCHLTRETRDVLAAVGFDTSGLRDVRVRPTPPLVSSHLIGVAVPR